MASSAHTARVGWAALVADAPAQFDGGLQVVRTMLSQGASGKARLLAGADVQLAALAVVRGPAAAHEWIAEVTSTIESAARSLQIGPSGLDEVTTIGVLVTFAVADAVGAPVELSGIDLDAVFDYVLVSRALSRPSRSLAALLALVFDRDDAAAKLAGKGALAVKSGDAAALTRLLVDAVRGPRHRAEVAPAWETFLRGFPAAFDEERADWRHLFLAARIVLARLGDVPPTEVSETLHRRVLELAAEPPA